MEDTLIIGRQQQRDGERKMHKVLLSNEDKQNVVVFKGTKKECRDWISRITSIYEGDDYAEVYDGFDMLVASYVIER